VPYDRMRTGDRVKTFLKFLRQFLCSHAWLFSERLPGGIVRVRCIRCKAEKVERV